MGAKNKEKHLGRTRSLCPECDAILDAELVERGGSVYIRKRCPGHGEFDLLLARDADFYHRCAAGSSKADSGFTGCDITGCLDCRRHAGHVKTIMIDVTERCNLNCTACFTNTHARRKRDPTIDEICRRLENWPAPLPTILLCGGEPTMRGDLPELIRAVTGMGFVVKMASNGIKLTDPGLVGRLRDAGLGWVLFQFDGFSDAIYRKTRGRDLAGIKEKALATLADSGIKVCLACMVVKGLNDGELGRMIDLMMASDHIMHIGATVLSCVGRDDFEEEYTTTAPDVLRAFERTTGGRITMEDFMRTRAVGNTLFRLTGNQNFKQKSCFHMLLLHNRPDGPFPVNRYLTPGGALLNPRGFGQMALLFGALRDWDAIALSGKVKLVTVEDFRQHDNIDLVDANRCNKVYMAERGFIPPCIYNTKYRPYCWLPEGEPAGRNQ